MVVSQYYPEMFQRKRSVKDHEGWGRIKSMILLELMKEPDTRSGLKLKLNEQLKREGSLPISIKTIVRHLRNPDKPGLIDLGIVRERNGFLELSLTTPRKIAKFIDELFKNKTIGPRVSYFIDRVFAEAFLSPFGDMFPNYLRIHEYIAWMINSISEDSHFEKKKKYNIITEIFAGRTDIIGSQRLGNLDNFKLTYETEEEVKEAIKIVNEMDILSIVKKAIEMIRGGINTQFKVSYVLSVMNKVNFISERVKDDAVGWVPNTSENSSLSESAILASIMDKSLKGVKIKDLFLFHIPNEVITRLDIDDKTIEEFKELLFKSIDGQLREDRSLNPDNAILDLGNDVVRYVIKHALISLMGQTLLEPEPIFGTLIIPED